jgi:hypothetical protein
MQTARMIIFCDGGLGNRINSLISGLAIAHYFKLSYCVHWPINNWCAASFSDLFKSKHLTSNLSIKTLRNQLKSNVFLLHDQIASEALNVVYGSAYNYESMHDFEQKVILTGKNIFYYPAVLPKWIPYELIQNELKNLDFDEYITSEVKKFILEKINGPFYGLHLRRTDLNVGLTDHEVQILVTHHKGKKFFVCSDDPIAESLASVHSNVYSRHKTSFVTKKEIDQGWMSQCQDDDDRTYHGNIFRGKDSVIQGTIDMLILAHSNIVGYSGSTFQSMSRMIGDINPIVSIPKPQSFDFFSKNELKKQIDNGSISLQELIQKCAIISNHFGQYEATSLLEVYYEKCDASDTPFLLYTLGIHCLNNERPRMAAIYFDHLTTKQPENHSGWLHLCYAFLLMNDLNSAAKAFSVFEHLRLGNLSDYELNLIRFIQSRIVGLDRQQPDSSLSF